MHDEELVDALVALGGTPTELIEIRDGMRLMIPTLRADLRAGRYGVADETPLNCPIHAYGGSEDSLASAPLALAVVAPHDPRGFSLRTFAGGHFYLRNNAPALVGDLAAQLRADTWQATA